MSEQISSDLLGYWRRHASQPGEQQEELLHEDLSWDNHEVGSQVEISRWQTNYACRVVARPRRAA
jgi:hypothetical protein